MRRDETPSLSRRRVLAWTGGFGAALATGLSRSGVALAEDAYPVKAIRLVEPFAAGGAVDIVGRLMAQYLSQDLGQPMVVENMGGGGGTIGSNYVAHAQPDGYTLVMHTSSSAMMNGLLYKSLPYDFETAFAPISIVGESPTMIIINANVPAKTLEEFVALVKANPGKYNDATTGVGSNSHLLGLLFCERKGLDIEHVPYKGTGELLKDLIAGRVQMAIGVAGPFLEYIRAGTLRALCVNGSKRIAVLPDVPTAAEAGLPNFQQSNWYALFGPRGLPQPIAQRLYQGVVKGLADPEVKNKLVGIGIDPVGSTPDELDKYFHDQIAIWRPVIKASGITLDN